MLAIATVTFAPGNKRLHEVFKLLLILLASEEAWGSRVVVEVHRLISLSTFTLLTFCQVSEGGAEALHKDSGLMEVSFDLCFVSVLTLTDDKFLQEAGQLVLVAQLRAVEASFCFPHNP